MRASKAATFFGGALALTALTAPIGAVAQQAAEGTPWLPFAGCWIEVDAPGSAPMTCIVPEEGGAAILTVSRGGEVERQLLGADGAERPVDAGGCVGVEAAESSRDGERIFTRSRLSCDGGSERATRGLMAMVSPDEWVQIRALTVGRGSVSWVKRYRVAPRVRVEAAEAAGLDALTRDREMAIDAARMAASAAPSVDDIIEAHARTDSEAVRAWIVEHGAPIRIDADRLVRMADAGVSEAVIDVVVAVTYPERFAVARESDRRIDDDRGRRGEWDRYGYDSRRCGLSSYYDPFFFGYRSYDYGRYGYSGYGSSYGSGYGCGYSPYGYYGSRNPTVVVVRPVGEVAAPGRAVKGRGYTRPGSGATSGTARPRQPSAQAGQGYSGAKASGGSSSSKGKAKPKGSGGGG